jgi:peptidoglycan/xylan/chitin deacetylase (PgdA/CDA1 family)
VHPDAFRRHVDWLTSGRVKATTLDDLVTLPSRSDAVAITFDDGFENFEEHGRRLLERGVPVTVFVVSDRVGKTNAWGDTRRRAFRCCRSSTGRRCGGFANRV